jgi:hypothetical protein
MSVNSAALALTLCLTTILPSVTLAIAPVIEPTGMWSDQQRWRENRQRESSHQQEHNGLVLDRMNRINLPLSR